MSAGKKVADIAWWVIRELLLEAIVATARVYTERRR